MVRASFGDGVDRTLIDGLRGVGRHHGPVGRRDGSLTDLKPLLLLNLVLEQVIEIGSSFAGVPSEKVETVTIGNRASPGSCFGLTVDELELVRERRLNVTLLSLIVHRHVPGLSLRTQNVALEASEMHVSPRVDLFRDLVHLIIDVAVSRSLKDLMPLFGFWVELVHVIRAAIRVCTRKKVEQTSMLNHSMPGPGSIDDPIVGELVPVVEGNHFALVNLAFFTLLFVHVLLRNHALPFPHHQIFVKFGVV